MHNTTPAPARDNRNWHNLPVQDALAALSAIHTGLSSDDVMCRLDDVKTACELNLTWNPAI